ncbi:MAG: S8 family serine peptidase [Acidobacteria bacterium]|nr:S8 family serine peptidase [Acidobacteriota bacterium]
MQNQVKVFRFSTQALLLAGFFLIQFPLSAQVQAPPQAASPVAGAPGNYILTFRPGTSQADRAASVRRAGATLRFNYNLVNAAAVTIPNANVFAALQRDATVVRIIPDHPVEAFGEVTPAGVTRVGVPTSNSDGSGIGVAIVDTGIDLLHADLQGGLGSGSFTAFGSSCQDDNKHGTHVAGIVGGRDNEIDVIGVAPASTLYCVKVLDKRGSGTDSTVIAGLDWIDQNASLVNPPIRVANMSLGRSKTADDTEDHPLRLAAKALYNKGIVIVAAAGNNSSKEVKDMVPAGYPEVFATASTTAIDGSNAGCKSFTQTIKADTASYFTTDGKLDLATMVGVTMSAPGEDKENVTKSCFASTVGILSLKLGGGTTRMSGTSMAAPHVAGIVARMMQTASYSADASGVGNIRTNIRSTADKKPDDNDNSTLPLDSPTSGYSYDGEREGIGQAP